jgi:hypothetical protein
MSKFYFYNAYGLGIKSAIPFPELKSAESIDFELVIQFYDSKSYTKITGTEDDFRLKFRSKSNIPVLWDGQLIFRVINGKEIIINPDVSFNEIFLRSLILGQGMAVILHQRGHLLLHASAVNIEGGAVVFLGECGYGKSTITVALNKRGYPLISDDVTVVNLEIKNEPVLIPSFSRIKLNNDIIKHINGPYGSFTQIHLDFEKHSFPAKNFFPYDSLPIKIIYILEKSQKNEIQPLKSQEKLINLIKNTYTQNILEYDEKANNLFECENLIKNVLIKRLNVFHSLEKLEELVSIVENDVIY